MKRQHARHHDRINQALFTFPRRLDDRIQWLLEFARRDLSRLPNKERLALDAVLKGIFPDYRATGPGFQGGYSVVPMSANNIRGIQQRLKMGLDSLLAGGGWRLPGTPDGIALERWAGSDGVYATRQTVLAEFPLTFWLAVADWLVAAGPRLRACPECHTPFLAIRRQTYCSPQCSQRVRTRRWYEAHTTEARKKRRQAYQQEIRVKLGPTVKVRRRGTVQKTGRGV